MPLINRIKIKHLKANEERERFLKKKKKERKKERGKRFLKNILYTVETLYQPDLIDKLIV